jgi:hypothetical protein
MACPVRKYPFNYPEGHEPPIPRWKMELPSGIDRVFTTYVGVQAHNNNPATQEATARAIGALDLWTKSQTDTPWLAEPFNVVRGDIPGSKVWVAYFKDRESWKRRLDALKLSELYALLGEARSSVGLWCEAFETAASRLETNYSGLDYLPGLGKLPGSTQQRHKLSAYWGAARDIIPGSGFDDFKRVDESVWTPPPQPAGIGERLVGTNYDNIVHIRSGQFWENTDDVERASYEDDLEPTLMTGLSYLWDNPIESGCMGLRFLQNTNADRTPRRETCGAGFFRSLGDLEDWAKKHPSHKAIFNGLMKHQKRFGPNRKLRTWHEVSVLKKGEAYFEYVNCAPETGTMRFLKLKRSKLE